MTMTDRNAGVWDDTNDMPLSQGAQRKRRIAALFTELAAMRPARRRHDPARYAQLEAELILLLDAELIGAHMKSARES